MQEDQVFVFRIHKARVWYAAKPDANVMALHAIDNTTIVVSNIL